MSKRHAWPCALLATSLLAAAPPHAASAGSRSTQYFGRGLELDFGSDFAVDLGGIPLNTPSHVHGPGYLDQALLIPETMGGCRYLKGPYQASQGAFASAGSVSLDLGPAPERPVFSFTYGGAITDRFARMLWMDHVPAARVTYALDASRNERPWNDLLGSSRLNALFVKEGEGVLGPWRLTVLGSEERSDSGAATPFRSAPPSPPGVLDQAKAGDGVRNQRLLLAWQQHREVAPGVSSRLLLYGGVHQMRKWNDWTYFLHDPGHGDQVEQVDRRGLAGLESARTWSVSHGGVAATYEVGVQARFDQVAAAEDLPSQNRVRLDASSRPAFRARADLLHGAVFGQGNLDLGAGWEAFLGMRLDVQLNRAYRFSGTWEPQDRGHALGSPRAGLSFTPREGTRFALQAGQGFRLGDAFRERQPMVRVRSVELSAQTRPLPPWTTSLTLWRLDLESEVLFDPDRNALTGRGPARHTGLEFYNELQRGPWHAEFGWAWNRAVFKDEPAGLDQVPGSVPQTGFVGLNWKGEGRSLGLRLRRTGTRPLTAGNTVSANRQDALEVRFQQDLASWSVAFEVLNAFGLKAYNHEYYYASRFPGEGPAGVMDRHLKPADPQTIRVEVSRRF